MTIPRFESELIEISTKAFANEKEHLNSLIEYVSMDSGTSAKIQEQAIRYIEAIRSGKSSAVEEFIHEFSLSTEEGVAIICLSEALLRISDRKTAMALIQDKLKNKDWKSHLWSSKSLFVNASAIGLLFTGSIVNMAYSAFSIKKLMNKLGKPVILEAVKRVIKLISNEYILGEDLKSALKNGSKLVKQGYKISFDILGESSRTAEQADFYYDEYIKAIAAISEYTDKKAPLYTNHNLSVKLTALHPRVVYKKYSTLEDELLPRLKKIINLCKEANISLSFDAEEAFRQDVYLKILTKLVMDPEFEGFDGIGFVVQGYQKRTFNVIDYIAGLAKASKKRLPIRLVKGAYWDSEIKFAQEFGLEGYPVFTNKENTDVSYLACAKKIIGYGDLFYPQFATHNAHTIAAVQEMIGDRREFEFQRLQGMGTALHAQVIEDGYFSRIYAPVGKYEDLLAYLMRRLLENGANSSFVNMLSDESKSASEIVSDPIANVSASLADSVSKIVMPRDIYGDLRDNSIGYDLGYRYVFKEFSEELVSHSKSTYEAHSIIAGKEIRHKEFKVVHKPANNEIEIGRLYNATAADLKHALDTAHVFAHEWANTSVYERAKCIRKFGALMQEHRHELYAMLIKEAGKNIEDAISEVREAIDFAEYYSTMAERYCGSPIVLPTYTGETNTLSWHPRGVFVCISPWNFPLAIYAGQITAALVTGNTVIAKPAENTSMIATFVAKLLHKSGIPVEAFNLAIARGRDISEHILSDNRVSGVCFTGSTSVALGINRTLAGRNACSIASFIAETGGQNAMIVDSSALLEQAADSIIHSAFGSVGQRCSALRVLYAQEEIVDKLQNLLIGYMNQMTIGDTEDLSCDLGPVISQDAKKELEAHIKEISKISGCSLVAKHKQHDSKALKRGSYVVPHIASITKISDLKQENFGPILHIIPFKNTQFDDVIAEINGTGFGLTFGVQSRIEDRINDIASKIHAGNIYANRTMIGAQVGTHPFGGENNSGTGFKAGGPHYLYRFMNERTRTINTTAIGGNLELLRG